jgi:multisubunit Na+/H+ antiporter MnhC subunit
VECYPKEGKIYYLLPTTKKTMNKRNLLAFVIGSSILSTAVTLAYVGRAYGQTGGADSSFRMEQAAVFIPIVYGFANVLLVNLNIDSKRPFLNAVMVGAALGLLFASVGTSLGANQMFDLEREQFLYAPPLYAAIMSLIVLRLNKALLL